MEPDESIYCDDPHTGSPGLRAVREPVLEHLPQAFFHHVGQLCGAGLVEDRRQINDDRDESVTAACVHGGRAHAPDKDPQPAAATPLYGPLLDDRLNTARYLPRKDG